METPRIAIIGAGPAGIATSIQLKRLGYDPQLFEKDLVGGLLRNANLIENYPGFPNGISGPALIDRMELQLKQLEIEVKQLKISRLFFEKGLFRLQSDKEVFISDFVVVASGTKPKPININISKAIKKLIHNDIKKILDINNKHIVIIGAGDAAFDHALNLSRNNRVSVINRGTNIRSLQLLVDRVLANKKINYLENTIVKRIKIVNIKKCDRILKVECVIAGESNYSIECNEVVFAIGRDPQLDFMDQFVTMDKCLLVGDVKNGIFRQATIAIGDGIKAAMKIHNQVLSRY